MQERHLRRVPSRRTWNNRASAWRSNVQLFHARHREGPVPDLGLGTLGKCPGASTKRASTKMDIKINSLYTDSCPEAACVFQLPCISSSPSHRVSCNTTRNYCLRLQVTWHLLSHSLSIHHNMWSACVIRGKACIEWDSFLASNIPAFQPPGSIHLHLIPRQVIGTCFNFGSWMALKTPVERVFLLECLVAYVSCTCACYEQEFVQCFVPT